MFSIAMVSKNCINGFLSRLCSCKDFNFHCCDHTEEGCISIEALEDGSDGDDESDDDDVESDNDDTE